MNIQTHNRQQENSRKNKRITISIVQKQKSRKINCKQENKQKNNYKQENNYDTHVDNKKTVDKTKEKQLISIIQKKTSHKINCK